jgi:hypothetical protein
VSYLATDDVASMSGGNAGTEYLKDEYVALMRWRASKLGRQDIWGAILLPSAFAVYGKGLYDFLSKPTTTGIFLLGLSWFAASVLLLLWRWNDYLVDDTIKKYAYPRLLELEDQLGFQAVKEFVQSSFSIDLDLRRNSDSRDKYVKKLGGDQKSPGFVDVLKRVFTFWKKSEDPRNLFKWDRVAGFMIVLSGIIVLFITLNREKIYHADNLLGRIEKLESISSANVARLAEVEQDMRVTKDRLSKLEILTFQKKTQK